ncbi:MAG: endonuclease/exonuclease/phosphatase family protein [Bradymonadaceae bacterium]
MSSTPDYRRTWAGGLAVVAFLSAGLVAEFSSVGSTVANLTRLVGLSPGIDEQTPGSAAARPSRGNSHPGRVDDRSDGESTAPRAANSSTTRELPGDLTNPDVISVLTMNLQTGLNESADIDDRTQIVVEYIKQHRPDVVGLQEVSDSSEYRHRKKILRRRTDYNVVYKQTQSVPYLYEEGLAILSRWPVKGDTASRSLPYKGVGTIVTPLVQTAVAYHPQRTVQLFNTHLNFSPSREKKLDQAKGVLEFVRDRRRDVPTFLVGDMNAKPDSRAMKLLRGETTVDGLSGRFVDAWHAARPNDRGWTSPAPDVSKRIDYIYFLPPDGVITVKSCHRVFEDEVDGVRASDHLGVWCDFRLEPQK